MNQFIHILIVDDEKNLRTTLADILTEEGYQVATAASGAAALALCVNQPFDVILLDVRLPDQNGVEVLRQMRQHQRGARVIMMSAYSVDELQQAALHEGAIAFLAKPLDLDRVIRLVREAKDTTILFVEADEPTAKLALESLKQQGYRVTVVPTPGEALVLVEQIRFDVIFIDAELPVMNGLELYLHIKKLTPRSIAVMIAGREVEVAKLAQEAVQQTAYTILPKPLEIDQLLALVQRITGQRAAGVLQKPEDTE